MKHMKSTDRPQLSQQWWEEEKPDDLGATELDDVLPDVESALAEQRKHDDDLDAVTACIEALRAVPSAASKTIKSCDKKKHKNEIAVLKKYDALVSAEVKRLEKIQKKLEEQGKEEEDEEEDEDKIFQKDYLYKMVKMLKSTGKALNFGFALDNKNPGASKLLLTRKGKPERLLKALKRTGEFSDRQITYGTAAPDAKDGKTLVFKLAESAGEPPQVLKLGRQFLQSDKGLKFRKLKLVLPGGKTFDDAEGAD
jgi:hypothetical protein